MDNKLYRSIHDFILNNTFSRIKEKIIKRLPVVFVLFVFYIFRTGLIKSPFWCHLKKIQMLNSTVCES